ncbi:MAG: hypothetical protein Q4G33_01625 [bacterium]|nr:hypothetical protein [bacterium]
MLENLYTTKMSANRKTLQNRFSQIRSEGGRFSKIMAAVMSAVVAVTMLCATVVMAAVGTDGLEHWDDMEVYYTGGLIFDINISGLNVPEYVKNEIAGEDGNIHCCFDKYDLRYPGGIINDTGKLTLSGNRGQMIFALMDNYWPFAPDSQREVKLARQNDAEFMTGYIFCVSDSKFSSNAMDAFNIPLADSEHWINIYFAISDNKPKKIIFSFDGEYVLSEDYRRINIGENMDCPEVQNVKFLGDLKDVVPYFNKMVRGGRVFNAYEQKYYQNIKTDDFIITLASADENSVSLINRINYSGESIDFALVQIYDENNIMVFDNDVRYPDLNGLMKISAPNDERLEHGRTYRVETSYWHGSMDNLIYRRLDYVTIR